MLLLGMPGRPAALQSVVMPVVLLGHQGAMGPPDVEQDQPRTSPGVKRVPVDLLTQQKA